MPRHVHPRQTAPVTETKINSEPDQMRRERPGLAEHPESREAMHRMLTFQVV